MLRLDVTMQRGDFRLGVRAELDGGATGLFGRSGAGKTSLLHLILGLNRPDRGRIALADRTLVDTEAGVFVPCHQRRIGAVFQDARLLPHYSVEGNLRYGMRLTPASRRRLDMTRIADLLEIGPLLKRRTRGLSGGERQRVALARTLLASPDLLLLDEPLASLDAPMKRQILPLLRRVRDEAQTPIVYVSHDLDDTLYLADRLLVLERGSVVGCGRYADLAQATDALPTLMSGGEGLLNVFTATVEAHETDRGCMRLVAGSGPDPARTATIRAPLVPGFAAGSAVTISIRAEDIALARGEVGSTSIQNQVAARVTRLAERDGLVVVEVDAGVPLLVEVSAGARRDLDLRPGQDVRCLVKAQAVHVGTG